MCVFVHADWIGGRRIAHLLHEDDSLENLGLFCSVITTASTARQFTVYRSFLCVCVCVCVQHIFLCRCLCGLLGLGSKCALRMVQEMCELVQAAV